MTTNTVITQLFGIKEYQGIWHAMQQFTNQRTEKTLDEIWVVEHLPIFTQGQNGKAEHLLNPGTIPVQKVDRGGQVTYHGPGQLVVYTLIDIQRKKWTIRQLVTLLEQSVLDLLSAYHIAGNTDCKAPGVYVNQQKICSLGLRIRKGAAFHGLALNVKMDLEPFSRINPCGFSHLKMTQLTDFLATVTMEEVTQKLLGYLIQNLGYTKQINNSGE